jgi:uncharacterized RDD family membrane protein YckC
MQMTTEARAWLDATVRRILARHPLGDAERAGITYELMSHLHAAGEARAKAAGRAEVGPQDLEAGLADSGGEDGLAAAFVVSLAKPVQRVLFWRRLGALAIDALLLLVALGVVHGAVAALLEPFAGHGHRAVGDAGDVGWVVPYGYHDPTLDLWAQGVISLASGALVLGYFGWLESREGRSLGKRALGLRVVRVDGRPMGVREAVLRNLVKLVPLLLVADTLVMLLAFRKDRQRVSDKIAETIVIRT